MHQITASTAVSDLFHPKVYLFRNERRIRCVVGSPNLTNAAMSCNLEASVLLDGSSIDAALAELSRFVAKAWSGAEDISHEFLYRYRYQYAAKAVARVELTKFADVRPPRFAQHRIPWGYLKPLGLDLPVVGGVDPEAINRYNVAPHSKVRITHWDPDGLRWDLVQWWWEPFWAKGKRPPAINTRGETAATGKFFSSIWKTGRCVIPADGWYEWVKDPRTQSKNSRTTFVGTTGNRCILQGLASSDGTAESRRTETVS